MDHIQLFDVQLLSMQMQMTSPHSQVATPVHVLDMVSLVSSEALRLRSASFHLRVSLRSLSASHRNGMSNALPFCGTEHYQRVCAQRKPYSLLYRAYYTQSAH